MVARAKVCMASSSGKPSMERATVWYTKFPPRVTIDDAMRVDKMVRNCSLGRQKKPSSRASACILSSLRRLEVTIFLGVGAGDWITESGLAVARRDVFRAWALGCPANERQCSHELWGGERAMRMLVRRNRMRVVPRYIDPCANIGYGCLQVLGSGAPDKSRKAIGGSRSVDGAAGTMGPDCDAGRGGVVDPGGESGGRGLLMLEATGRSDKRRLILKTIGA